MFTLKKPGSRDSKNIAKSKRSILIGMVLLTSDVKQNREKREFQEKEKEIVKATSFTTRQRHLVRDYSGERPGNIRTAMNQSDLLIFVTGPVK